MRINQLKAVFAMIAVAALVAMESTACKGSSDASASGASKAAKGASGSSGSTATDIDNGGITEVSTDAALVKKGEKLFAAKTCNACHAMGERKVGPALGGVTDRRSASWIAQMILHPAEMVKKDPEAKKLFEEYGTPMATPPVSAEEAKALIAYLGSQK